MGLSHIKARIKSFNINKLPRSISRLMYGDIIGQLSWEKRENGLILASGLDTNLITDQFKQDLLELMYVGLGGDHTAVYMGLANSAPNKDSTLGNTVEVAGTGYARQTIQRNTLGWPVRGLVNNDWIIQSLLLTFTASSTWTTANYGFLTNVQSGINGRLWNFLALSQPVELTAGQEFTCNYKITLR